MSTFNSNSSNKNTLNTNSEKQEFYNNTPGMGLEAMDSEDFWDNFDKQSTAGDQRALMRREGEKNFTENKNKIEDNAKKQLEDEKSNKNSALGKLQEQKKNNFSPAQRNIITQELQKNQENQQIQPNMPEFRRLAGFIKEKINQENQSNTPMDLSKIPPKDLKKIVRGYLEDEGQVGNSFAQRQKYIQAQQGQSSRITSTKKNDKSSGMTAGKIGAIIGASLLGGATMV